MENLSQLTPNEQEKSKHRLEDLRKKGIDFSFEHYPELLSIGSKKEYSEYLDTIFSESKIKNIIWHHTGGDNFNEFDPSRYQPGDGYFSIRTYSPTKAGFFFVEEPLSYYSKDIMPVLINLKKPIPEDKKGILNMSWDDASNDDFIKELGLTGKYDGYIRSNYFKKEDNISNNNEYVVFRPEQIHILGSKKDIEKFKSYKQKN